MSLGVSASIDRNGFQLKFSASTRIGKASENVGFGVSGALCLSLWRPPLKIGGYVDYTENNNRIRLQQTVYPGLISYPSLSVGKRTKDNLYKSSDGNTRLNLFMDGSLSPFDSDIFNAEMGIEANHTFFYLTDM